jgi:1-acyl-sn-glycerol-3-phosphate acyltransferase
VARLALESRAPVVPCAMMNTFEFLPPGSRNPKFSIRPGVIFGQPMEFSRYYGRERDREALRAVTDEIIAEIAKLSGQEYVNIYAKRAKEQAQADRPDTDSSMLSIASPGVLLVPLQEAYGRLGFALCEWESLPGAATARD